MVVTGSDHPSVIRNICRTCTYSPLDNGKSHACQWMLSRTHVVLTCMECRTSVVLVARRPFSRNMSKPKLPTELKLALAGCMADHLPLPTVLLAELDHSSQAYVIFIYVILLLFPSFRAVSRLPSPAKLILTYLSRLNAFLCGGLRRLLRGLNMGFLLSACVSGYGC